jgi:2-C-methyl-D-erythritol 4-phosphate cytidylyltransferase/2-C-methyl-D-erythritol 2,4-cyclodiphosphate synthase
MSRQPRPSRYLAVVPAAGVGTRVGADRPKQYLDVAGATLLEWSVRSLLAGGFIDLVIVVVAPGDERAQALVGRWSGVRVAPVGGATRRDSVLAGLEAAGEGWADHDWVLVHDAARPGLGVEALGRLHAELAGDPVGGLLAEPVSDTVKRQAGDAAHVGETILRDGLWLAQTPQMFRLGLLRAALRRHPGVTDESAAIEADGHRPRLVRGDRGNFKVTTAEDLLLMDRRLGAEPAAPEAGGATQARDQATGLRAGHALEEGGMRIGQGYDVHALVPGRRLVLGGVSIDHPRGLLGHSDADALLHAVTDALLGAAGLGDIGGHFPDTDPRWRGADSRSLLRAALARVHQAGWQVGNADATVVAQAPRLAPHVPAMRANLAADLGVPVARVNVKAKTHERLGFEGREEGIAAQAVVLLVPLHAPEPAGDAR